MSNETQFTDITVGSRHAFHMNGVELDEKWVITGVNLIGKGRLMVTVATEEEFAKDPLPEPTIPMTDEKFAEFKKALKSCRTCLHPTGEHDYAGCNNINFSTEVACRCLIPFGGQSTGPKD